MGFVTWGLVAGALTLGQSADTIVPVERGMRLHARNEVGSVRVTTWERDAVELSLGGGQGRAPRVVRSGRVLDIDVRPDRAAPRGRAWRRWYDDEAATDLLIRVPAYMAVEVSGVETDIRVIGVAAAVTAETHEGSVEVRGGVGFVRARSIDGIVVVDGAQGQIQIDANDGNVTVRRVQGEVTVESIDGNIELIDMDARQVRAATVDGNIWFRGVLHTGGRYHLSTHDGSVTATVPEGSNASVIASTFEGDFETQFPVQLRGSTRHRIEFTLGDGSAVLELESFDGNIRLLRRP